MSVIMPFALTVMVEPCVMLEMTEAIMVVMISMGANVHLARTSTI